ncbi:hypothetical protein [Flammeovirga sp. SubArs3]|nr:hypothetical protein [Flammeovirga sp. SubArs3]
MKKALGMSPKANVTIKKKSNYLDKLIIAQLKEDKREQYNRSK